MFIQFINEFIVSIFQGSYIQVGDIVSLVDMTDDIYYAQVRGLLIDSYCEKSAFLTWLLPTTSSPLPSERFDASSYIIGTRPVFFLFYCVENI